MIEINKSKATEAELLNKASEDIYRVISNKLNEDKSHEDDDVNYILEISPSTQFHKKNRKYFQNISYIDSSYLAIEPQTGKQVIWNEIFLDDTNVEKENRFFSLINRLQKFNHPFLLRFYEAWLSKNLDGVKKIVFVTERITTPTIREYITHTNLSQRLNDKASWRKMVCQLLSGIKFLHDSGALHGKITSESVHQSNNIIKLGLGAIDLLSDNISPKNLCDFGILILEMCAYQCQYKNGNFQSNDVSVMLGRVLCDKQKTFINMSLNENCRNLKDLTNVFEVQMKNFPVSLKLLAGRIIVNNTVYIENVTIEKNRVTTSCIYDTLLVPQTEHFDNDTVIVRCRKSHENEKVMKWVDFALIFSLLPKFLKDINNGFYDIFKSDYQTKTNNLIDSEGLVRPLSISDFDVQTDSQDDNELCYLKPRKSRDSDSISLENQEFFKDLEVKEKIFIQHDNSDETCVSQGTEEKENLINIKVDQLENQDSNLIDLHTPIENNGLANPPIDENRNQCWDLLFDDEIRQFNTNDDLIQFEILPHKNHKLNQID